MMLHIDKLLADEKQIWVRNVHSPKGIICLTLASSRGQVKRIDIPKTRHPICLSSRATPDMMLNSFELRELIDKGVLELLDPAAAEKEFSKPGVAEQVRKAYASIGYGNADIMRMRDTGNKESDALAGGGNEEYSQDLSSVPIMAQSDADDDGDAESEEDPDVNTRVKVLVDLLSTKEKRARDVKSDLEDLDLTRSDLAYIIRSTTGLVKTFAQERFAALSGQALANDDDDEDYGDDGEDLAGPIRIDGD